MKMRSLHVIPLIALVAACAPSEREPAPVVYRGTAPGGAQSQASPSPVPAPAGTAAAPSYDDGQADANGIIRYDGYETIRARRGDTVEAMAARAGVPAAELAAYNGLSTQYSPEAGDELVLPARSDRYDSRVVAAAPRPSATGVQSAPPPANNIPSTYQPSVSGPETTGQTTTRPAASGSGWSAELARAAIDQPETETAPAPAPVETPAAAPAPAPAPQSTPAPRPAPEPVVTEEPAPAVVALNTNAAPSGAQSGGQFLPPTTAPIARPFSRAPGPDRNDGVDYATVAGDPVVAAANGAVALISKSLGGLGTIVLIRHDNQFLTVYGRLADVTVAKGDQVQRGQVIATVADLRPPKNPHLHFEVRKGAESVDPTQYF